MPACAGIKIMNYKILKIEEKDGVLIVTICRPQALNALNSLFFKEMDDVISSIESKPDIRVMIITGEGKAFAAGADIAEMVDKDSEAGRKFSRLGQNTFQSLETLNIPVIAAVNGFALGGGCELMMGCDFRIASSFAKFGQPEVSLGLTPGYAGTQRLPRQVGKANGLYLLLTGVMISAEDALRMGLIQKIVKPGQLMEEALKIAETIKSKGPKAIAKVKQLVHKGMETDFEIGCRMESEEFGSLFDDEGKEGIKAFLEKRQANW
jgi:enoyl-CoA hydratase